MGLALSDLWDSTVLSSLAFLICTLVLFHKTAKRVDKDYKTFSFVMGIVLFAWFFIVLIFAKNAYFPKNPFFVPFMFIAFLVIFQGLLMVYRSERVTRIANALPQHWLIAIQTYRIVGVGFLFLYAQGILPGHFAFPSAIGDIVVGITAPFVAWAYYNRKKYSVKLAVIWNIIGILDLIIAISAGVIGFPIELSSTTIQMLPSNPSTEPMSLFPLAAISLFAVPLAILMHCFSLRVLKRMK